MRRNFTLVELTASATAKAKGIDNTPDAQTEAHLWTLVDNLLQPLREAWGKPIIVTNGYRCQELNVAVGGAQNSAHRYGWAADIQPKDMEEFDRFCGFIAGFVNGRGLHFDQIIVETSTTSKWVHIGYMRYNGEQRCQLFDLTV